jgi:UDP-4-amino-4,6-dideoxy-N-acetyl-beta-L-altrosamine N-acetyltransferase
MRCLMYREDVYLRPIEERDLAPVLLWRNSERVRSCMYTDHIITPDEHRAWFEHVHQSEFPSVLIFEYKGVPAGLKSFSRIDRRNNRCYWGFYLGDAELPRGCGTAMGFLALEYIFEQHNFHKLCAEAFAFNEGSIKYHTRLGFSEEGRFLEHVIKNGHYEDIVSFAIFRKSWLANKSALAAKVFRGERRR